MWYTTRYEGFDGSSNNFRSPKGVTALHHTFSAILRTGFLLKVISLTGLILTYHFYRGNVIFTYDLQYSFEEQRATNGFRILLCLFSGIYLLGALHIMGFQAILADDASWARGYRAGSKLLANAALFDVISSIIQFIIYAYMMTNYDKIWWRQFCAGGPEWLFSALARLFHAFALLYYSSSLFLLEVYHDTGTNDWHGVLHAFLFFITAVAEITALTTATLNVAIAFNWISLISALIWAMAFEQEVNALGPQLNEPELDNEVERQVEKFVRSSPYLAQAVV